MRTPETLAEGMKAEILKLVGQGIVPANVKGFSALHDYVDANMLGDAEKLLDEVSLDAAVDLLNPAQTIVDAWIKGGGIPRPRGHGAT